MGAGGDMDVRCLEARGALKRIDAEAPVSAARVVRPTGSGAIVRQRNAGSMTRLSRSTRRAGRVGHKSITGRHARQPTVEF
jgi:hypothetical protein